MSGFTVSDLKDIVTIIGVVIAATSLAFTAINTLTTVRTNRAKFWLDLRDRFAKHDEVHRLLRPGGDWSTGKGPETAEEWARVEAYLGLFEHCEIMLEQGLIDERTFREIYVYRLKNMAANSYIREKLNRHAGGWSRLLALMKRMGIDVLS
ncbi:MAG: hypothetical protein CTY34_07995 [Methylobacter sp.]|nr:MAG: hypothetical protein CTY34_07995 [Methylobacter sp.]PPD37146.1 MAG: hypothetical protein CTY18_02240 [Methylomonas sp.]